MKILILSHPFSYSWRISRAIANDLNYKCILDPFDKSLPKLRKEFSSDGSFIEVDFAWWNSIPGHNALNTYSWGDEVEDNSVICHMVGTHKLPQNLTERQFIGQFTGSFDRVFSITSRNINTSQDFACIASAKDNGGNEVWKKWNELNVGNYGWEYESSYYNEEVRDKIYRSHEYIIGDLVDENVPVSYVEDFMFTEDLSDINSEITKWNIGLEEIIIDTTASDPLSGSIHVFNACAKKLDGIVY
tara:strand:- start:746 stop:1480 length:735 start_codon:yes stop_codon:yes gene_type:complete